METGFPRSCLEKIQGFPGPQNVFSRTLYTASVLLDLLYMTSSTANTLDQVHCTQRYNTHMHYIWNTKYFEIYCQFVSVSKSPNLALRMLVNLNHNWIPGLSRTNLISQDFPGPGNFRKINQGLSWSVGTMWRQAASSGKFPSSSRHARAAENSR